MSRFRSWDRRGQVVAAFAPIIHKFAVENAARPLTARKTPLIPAKRE
jgi:hypothetical protein